MRMNKEAAQTRFASRKRSCGRFFQRPDSQQRTSAISGHYKKLQKITAITCRRDFSFVFFLTFFSFLLTKKRKSSALEGRRRDERKNKVR